MRGKDKNIQAYLQLEGLVHDPQRDVELAGRDQVVGGAQEAHAVHKVLGRDGVAQRLARPEVPDGLHVARGSGERPCCVGLAWLDLNRQSLFGPGLAQPGT